MMIRRFLRLSSVLIFATLWVVPTWAEADTLELSYEWIQPDSALVTVKLDNAQAVGSVAMVLEYSSDQLTIDPESITGMGRAAEWSVTANIPEEGELRIALIDLLGGSLDPGAGPIVLIPVQANAWPTSIQFKVDGHSETAVFLESGEPVPEDELETIGTTITGPETLGGPKVVPFKTRILVGLTRPFRVTGKPGTYIWTISDSSAEGVGSIDADGLFTAQAGGWVIIAAQDEEGSLIASTDTVVVMGGPTKIGKGRGGRVFSADDTLVVVHFPPQASDRAMTVLIEKRGVANLPEKAEGKARAVAVFEFMATDDETGEDVGKKGFKEKVRMTLHYEDKDIPEGVEEENLTVATFDEEADEWKKVPKEEVVEVDREENTITVETEHFSLWAIVDQTSLAEQAVEVTTWGRIKAAF